MIRFSLVVHQSLQIGTKSTKYSEELAACTFRVVQEEIFLDNPEDGGSISYKASMSHTNLHVVIYQRTIRFINSAVITSNYTYTSSASVPVPKSGSPAQLQKSTCHLYYKCALFYFRFRIDILKRDVERCDIFVKASSDKLNIPINRTIKGM